MAVQILKCSCGQELHLGEPVVEIVNAQTFAAIVLNFGTMSGRKCTACGTEVLVNILEVNMSNIKTGLAFKAAEKAPTGLILPPGYKTQ